ncbi:SIR2 family NAD-dependent protein deacylase [Salinispira pacifica]
MAKNNQHSRSYGDLEQQIERAAGAIRNARYLTAFTGAGISTESGVPPFRGPGGLWERYDPAMLELSYFLRNPSRIWPILREIFYSHFGAAEPNPAHRVLAKWEAEGTLKVLVTQNIDDLHFRAGSRNVVEYHGNSRRLRCTRCGAGFDADEERLSQLPPRCSCGGILKPDFIFFGEMIPEEAVERSSEAVERTDVMLVIGSTGEVYPAAGIPMQAAARGATIIEVNPSESSFTAQITDIFIQMEAGTALPLIDEEMNGDRA